MDARGRGEGEVMPAVRVTVTADGRYMFVENYDSEALRLNNVEAVAPSRPAASA